MDEPTPEAVANAQDSAETPLEETESVALVEVDDPGEEPPESWGQDGDGDDDPPAQHVEVSDGGE